MNVTNKVFVITGAGNGMGRAITMELLRKGAKVAAVDISENGLNETLTLAKEFTSNLSLHVINIADKVAVEYLPSQVIAQYGAIDGIINNAGIIQPFVRINDLDYKTIERVFNINFYGLLYITKSFLPHLLKRPEAYVVNISSMGGFLPVPGQSVYGASKAAVKLLSEALNAELRETKVHVTTVFPGAIATNIIDNSGAGNPNKPAPKLEDAKMKPLAPEKAAQMIVHAIEKNKARIFVGKDSRFLDWMYRISPSFATNMVAKQIKAYNLID